MPVTTGPRSPLDVRPTSGLLKALADDTRLRMLALLSRGELCVCHVATTLELTQPNASQHLAVLRNAGIVEARRDGGWTYYRLVADQDPFRARILGAVLDGLAELDASVEDRRRLAAATAGACE